MGRYLGPKCKLCRREGSKLFLKGDRCFTGKCAIDKRRPTPRGGGFISKRRGKMSEYAIQLREKQKIRRYYGVFEKQFRAVFHKAASKVGVTGEIMLQHLELRLDSVVYALGLAASRCMAKQIISHGHICVNGSKVSIPSFTCREGDVVSVKEKSRTLRPVMESLKDTTEGKVPAWLELNIDKMEGRIVRSPQRDDIHMPFNEQLVVELYSK